MNEADFQFHHKHLERLVQEAEKGKPTSDQPLRIPKALKVSVDVL